ncbi:MAG: histidine phosphatase family protein [Acidobacteriaceae bacterium]|nr:histidine phosphatase family protein [Acidobacteriaceae bacterium]
MRPNLNRHRPDSLQQLMLIRHASTDMAGTLCGQSDPPLNAAGIKESESLAQRLQMSSVPYRLYASDLKRAMQTAQPIAKLLRISIMARAGLREMDFGEWEGKRWAQIAGNNSGTMGIEALFDVGPPGGETFARFRKRVLQTLGEVITESKGQPVAIVTHLGVMVTILGEFAAATDVWTPPRIDYCGVCSIGIKADVLEKFASRTSTAR